MASKSSCIFKRFSDTIKNAGGVPAVPGDAAEVITAIAGRDTQLRLAHALISGEDLIAILPALHTIAVIRLGGRAMADQLRVLVTSWRMRISFPSLKV